MFVHEGCVSPFTVIIIINIKCMSLYWVLKTHFWGLTKLQVLEIMWSLIYILKKTFSEVCY